MYLHVLFIIRREKRISIDTIGIYHIPVYKVSFSNEFTATTIYKYFNLTIRSGKTDRLDADGLDNWFLTFLNS